MKNEPTLEQHLSNILYGLKKSTMNWDEQENVKASFNFIADLVLKPKEEPKQE